jgi:TrmH family RNA methyltransferase
MISKSQISYIKSLQQKKFRKEHQQFIIEGDKICDEFLSSEYVVHSIYVLEHKREKYELLSSKLSKKTEIVVIREEDMGKLSNMSTAPEVLAVVEMPAEPSIDAIYDAYLAKHLVLVLDGVKDPGNMGTIIRIADWFGIEHIICSDDCVEIYNPKVIE